MNKEVTIPYEYLKVVSSSVNRISESSKKSSSFFWWWGLTGKESKWRASLSLLGKNRNGVLPFPYLTYDNRVSVGLLFLPFAAYNIKDDSSWNANYLIIVLFRPAATSQDAGRRGSCGF